MGVNILMKSVIIKNDKGFFVGVDERQIDAIATKAVVAKALEETDEYKAHREKYYEIKEIQAQVKCAETKAQAASLKAKWQEEVELYNSLGFAVGSKSNQLFEELTVYFEPGRNEIVPELQQQVDTLVAMKANLAEKEFIKLDGFVGTVVKDQRGTYYLESGSKWKEEIVSEIGVEPSNKYKLYDDLSDAEKTALTEFKNAERIEALSATAKQAEFDGLVTAALNEAAGMKARLEVAGDPDALTKSQESFKAAVAVLEEKYDLEYEPLT